ncbi:peptidoglycan-binding protein [Planotetraspora sp. A-T 1434]|uniref:peptidoglycan-binding protein n=1 Tax=Planotetraspora sp. A-T 1434 TaxID=2979219 RepID=UPI0021BF7E1F|nr:peptidoglycan-binding protein [Planotetraspora sp. A-T 1434]MCT9934388.1 peptidoglycan-binding protein [Planotetraspora sp. A-T 1434]
MPKPSELLREMTRYLDYAEPVSGKTVFGATYRERKQLEPAFDVAPWCDMFIAQCSLAAGGADMLDVVGDFALTTSHAEWFREHDRWHAGTAGIRAGDIVFFDWSGGKKISAIDHVATVEKVISEHDIQTIDGNVGDTCKRRRRTSALVVGYGRPAYDGTPSSPDVSLISTLAELGHAPDFPGVVRPGQNGKNVRRVQEKLRRRQFGLGPSGVDGDFGPATKAAVVAFQESVGLEATGLVDEKTWEALWEAPIEG